MSADNWAVCPRCLDEARQNFEHEKVKVGSQYGQIPAEEYIAKREALTPPDPESFCTFREDYEFYGAEAGEVVASYNGGCSRCGLGVEFKETRRFWP